MNQYCRYCAWLSPSDYYCEKKKICLSEKSCKRINKCKNFEFNEIDVFDITRIYKPKPQNKKLSEQLKLDL